MWLINASTRKLEYFSDEHQQRYAILSHTWTKDEVTFQDIQSGEPQTGERYAKIEHTCRKALDQKLQYAWIDTCCIDKKSSAELSEAINSMFSYYRNASICYVYLCDAAPSPLLQTYIYGLQHQELSDCVQLLKDCRWFTRGWTLQEMLASSDLHFFDSTWTFIGDKRGLRGVLKTITGIDEAALDHFTKHNKRHKFSIAQKMSWAANRETTRLEDRAYSLLGIFDVNLPLIYGEGERAFIRLQQEIIRTSSDDSIFAWHYHNYVNTTSDDLLASSPLNFAQLSTVVAFHERNTFNHPQLSNQGLQTRVIAVKNLPVLHEETQFYAVLRCRHGNHCGPLALCLTYVGQNLSGTAVFCVSEHVGSFEKIHSRVALIPSELVKQAEAQPISAIVLNNGAGMPNVVNKSTLFGSEQPKVWVRVKSSRPGWADLCELYPQECWVERDVFALDTRVLEPQGQIGCRILKEKGYPHNGRAIAVAFSVKYVGLVHPQPECNVWTYQNYKLKVSIGEPGPALTSRRVTSSAQVQYVESLLADSKFATDPCLSWAGNARINMTTGQENRMAQDLIIIDICID